VAHKEIFDKLGISDPTSLGLGALTVKLAEVKAEGPDDEGDVRFEIKFVVVNNSNMDYEYFVSRAQLIGSHQQAIEEARDTHEQTLRAGEEIELESYLNVSLKLLGEQAENRAVLLSVVACGMLSEKLGEFHVPSEAFKVVNFEGKKIGDLLKVINGGFWKTEPDSDKDSAIELRVLIQNRSPQHLHEVRIVAEIYDKAGRLLTDANSSDEVRAGDLALVRGFGVGKDKKFKDAKLVASIRAYHPLATGLCYEAGLELVAAQSDGEGLFDEDSNEPGSPLQESMGSIKSEVTIEDGESLVCISCRVAEIESEGVTIDISKLTPKQRSQLESTFEIRPEATSMKGFRFNTSKTSILLTWAIPEKKDALLDALNLSFDNWKISQDDEYKGNVIATSVEWSGDSKGIGSETKVADISGNFVDIPDFLKRAEFEYDGEGSNVFGYEVIEANPWDVRIITRVGDEYRAEIIESNKMKKFKDWIVKKIK
jgi:hypothetical protein